MRGLLAFPFRLLATVMILLSRGTSCTAAGLVTIASFIDPQEPRP